ncbi:hypothetical protein ACKC9G_16835 [Pokkaliibacter sp. CJK22405]|uniref:hypothetical protein n=1 Tax=Pokkaliibacter sp. CJK22405 TaxID=3384615 RepID=UPI0039856897
MSQMTAFSLTALLIALTLSLGKTLLHLHLLPGYPLALLISWLMVGHVLGYFRLVKAEPGFAGEWCHWFFSQLLGPLHNFSLRPWEKFDRD